MSRRKDPARYLFDHDDRFGIDALVFVVEADNASVTITRGRVVARETTTKVVGHEVVTRDIAIVRIAGEEGFEDRRVDVERLATGDEWWSVAHQAQEAVNTLASPASLLERNPTPDLEDQHGDGVVV